MKSVPEAVKENPHEHVPPRRSWTVNPNPAPTRRPTDTTWPAFRGNRCSQSGGFGSHSPSYRRLYSRLLGRFMLVYPVSSLPFPKLTVVAMVALGVYLDVAADTMHDRLIGAVVAGLLSFVARFAVYAFPALVGWYGDPIARRSLYFSGLR